MYTHAGPEIGVASTRLSPPAGRALPARAVPVRRSAARDRRGLEPHRRRAAATAAAARADVEDRSAPSRRVAAHFTSARTSVLGRGINYPIALEGALKLKEISYIHAEGYPAGEMKHGPIALIDEQMPVVAIAPRDHVFEKMIGDMQEVKARGGFVIAVTSHGDDKLGSILDPSRDSHPGGAGGADLLTPILMAVPAAVAGLRYRRTSRLRRGSTAKSREVRDRRVGDGGLFVDETMLSWVRCSPGPPPKPPHAIAWKHSTPSSEKRSCTSRVRCRFCRRRFRQDPRHHAPIAFLVGEGHAKPHEVLAVTFTNKAAEEMRTRVESLLGADCSRMWVSTFHSLCARLLRREAPAIGLSRDFVIYDSSDQLSAVKQALKDLHIDDSFVQPRAALSRISHAKNRMESPEAMAAAAGWNRRDEDVAKVYAHYLKALKDSSALDFDDLLLKTVEPSSRPSMFARVREPVPIRHGRRGPGHEPAAISAHPQAGGRPPQPVRRRRSRSVDLQMARRRPAQHPRFRTGFSRSGHGQRA